MIKLAFVILLFPETVNLFGFEATSSAMFNYLLPN